MKSVDFFDWQGAPGKRRDLIIKAGFILVYCRLGAHWGLQLLPQLRRVYGPTIHAGATVFKHDLLFQLRPACIAAFGTDSYHKQ